MNLTIDIGNTNSKIALFENNKIIVTKKYKELSKKQLKDLYGHYKFNNVILSSVNINNIAINELDLTLDNFIELTYNTPLPIKNLYKSPKTLGNDRLAAAVAANNIFPANTVLIIDAGTAITYDIVTNNADFLGGNISPGLNMRYKALNEFTSNLPLLEESDNSPDFGNTTKSAVISGVQKGIIYEVEGYISKARNLYNNLKIILTGGDVNFFDKMLKKTIFLEPNLILIGLNRILEYNVKNI